jgi:bifunctional non-homologous end joining protein LigD
MGRGLPPLPAAKRGYGHTVPPAKRLEVTVGETTVSLSNLDKLMYPRAGFTKGHVIDYYTRIAPVLLPHLRARPLTLKRYPNGVEDKFFYEKRCPGHRPGWVRTAAVWSGRNEGDIDFCLCEDLPTLVWLANLADLELHTPLARVPEMDHPTLIAFDLDPGPPATIVECAVVALELCEAFDHLGMRAFPKTSGSKGMQVYLPLNTPVTYEDTRAFSRGLAQLLERRDPRRVVSDMAKAKRTGKVFVDWSQNDRHKTTVNVYSLRALERPTVSTPLTWDEVDDIASSGEGVSFTSDQVLERIAEHGDLFAEVQTLEQELPG